MNSLNISNYIIKKFYDYIEEFGLDTMYDITTIINEAIEKRGEQEVAHVILHAAEQIANICNEYSNTFKYFLIKELEL